MIGKEKIYKPAAEGNEINKLNSSDRFCVVRISSLLFFLIALDKVGNSTMPMAIPKIARGNWFKRSA